VKTFRWDPVKNETLRSGRGISFEEVIFRIEQDMNVAIIDHPNPQKYPNQKIFEILIGDYVYLVPFVVQDQEYFLKTIIPSRKATKRHLSKGDKE
jgi:uncharacterized DUF497 family protein